jgi:hypothetical protein
LAAKTKTKPRARSPRSTSSPKRARSGRPDPKPGTVEFFAEKFCPALTLDTGAKWELEEFQREIATDVMSGVREVLVLIPKGNAKTTLLAGSRCTTC